MCVLRDTGFCASGIEDRTLVALAALAGEETLFLENVNSAAPAQNQPREEVLLLQGFFGFASLSHFSQI